MTLFLDIFVMIGVYANQLLDFYIPGTTLTYRVGILFLWFLTFIGHFVFKYFFGGDDK